MVQSSPNPNGEDKAILLGAITEHLKKAIHETALIQSYVGLREGDDGFDKNIRPDLMLEAIQSFTLDNDHYLNSRNFWEKHTQDEIARQYVRLYYAEKRTAEAKTKILFDRDVEIVRARLKLGDGSIAGVSKEAANQALNYLTATDVLGFFDAKRVAIGKDPVKVDAYNTLLNRIATHFSFYGPNTLQKMEAFLRDYLNTRVPRERKLDEKYLMSLAKLRLQEHMPEIVNNRRYDSIDNIPGYTPTNSTIQSKTSEHAILMDALPFSDWFPGISIILNSLQKQNLAAPRGGATNEQIWLRDKMPIAFQVQGDNGPYTLLVHYDRPNLPRASYPYAEVNNQSRPKGTPEAAKAFKVGEQTVWAVPTEVRLKMQGGNFIKTKDHAIMTERIFRDNPSWQVESIKNHWAETAKISAEKVHFFESAPGELTGHADVVVEVINYEKNVVAVPNIPDYAISAIANDSLRVQIAHKYNEYLGNLANKLKREGLTVERPPMLAPLPKRDRANNLKVGLSPLPEGADVDLLTPVNWIRGPNNSLVVPVYSQQLELLTAADQESFHRETQTILERNGIRYRPIDATPMVGLNGGLRCVTAEVPSGF